jgi:hypothetical protein
MKKPAKPRSTPAAPRAKVLAPPSGLSPKSKALWSAIQQGYQVRDPAGLAVLEQCLRSLDRAELARVEVNRRGCTSTDRYGVTRMNPAAAVERDSRAAFYAGLKLLHVDVPLVDDDGEEG